MKKWLFLMLVLVLISACDPDNRGSCADLVGQTTIDNCYFEEAIAKADISICDNVNMVPLKEACISEIGISMNDLRLCDNLDKKAKGNCYAKIAINNENESICPLIESEYWFDICFYEVGLLKQEESICKKMLDVDKADECYAEIAELRQDEWACTWISMVDRENPCFIKLALSKENASICNWIYNPVIRDGNCIKRVAEKTGDIAICEMIKLVQIKEDCLESFKD